MKKLIMIALMVIAQPAMAAYPDTITDPAVRDAIDYLDTKIDSVMNTVVNSSATLGIPSGILPIIGGGTGAGTDAGARANLGVPSLTGDGATGTWNISITGTVALTNGLYGGGVGYIPYQSAQNTTAFLAPASAGYVLTSAGNAAPTWTEATHLSVPSSIVKRDANGDFAANVVTATTVNASFVGDGSGLTNLPFGLFELDDGNLIPVTIIATDYNFELDGDNNIQPL